MYQTVAKTYQRANFTTANPMRLVLMCYDGAIKSLKLARERYLVKDYEGKAKALKKALDIINEINVSLDLERGGDIARNLRSLYLYMVQTLTDADLKRDVGMFDQVIRMLEELESAWKEIARVGMIEAESAPYAMPSAHGQTASPLQTVRSA
ncbi:MAG: flagellar export chaperone FliS [Syntrophales bacterium]